MRVVIEPMPKRSNGEVLFLAVASVVAWSGLIVQLISSLQALPNFGAALWRLVSYYTIITNLITALFFTGRLLNSRKEGPNWTTNPSLAAWVCVSIVFVGVSFGVLLAGLYHFEGLAWWANGLLHYVTPCIALLYFLAFLRDGRLSWRDPFVWSLSVILYGVYALIRGSMSGFYPYPFIDLPTIGIARLVVNMLGMLAAFCILGSLFVLIDRKYPRSAESAR